jgi:hypothetical protein
MTLPHQDHFCSAGCAARLRKLVPTQKLVNGVITAMNDHKSQHAVKSNSVRHIVRGKRDGTDALDHCGTLHKATKATSLPLGGEVRTRKVEQIARSDSFYRALTPLGVLPVALKGSAFAEFQRRELIKWGNAVRDRGATID